METQGEAASGGKRHVLARHAAVMQRRAERLDPTMRALLWSGLSGLLFVVLNSFMRGLSLVMDGFQVQFLRYLMGLAVMVPFMARAGFASYKPVNTIGQFTRGGVHTIGLLIWFVALPRISLADTTAISFTTPIFIMLGAALVLKEPMRWERWLASAIGFAGVLIVVGPKLSGSAGIYNLVMLCSSPVYAASYLMTKSLARYERAEVIVVWQAVSVTLFSLPLALLHWQAPSVAQLLLFVLCGMLGSAGHYCLTRSYAAADISASQSIKFLDLVWASIIGWFVFADAPSRSTIVGGLVIFGSTLWIARRESRGPR